jgi:hypothetical protein
MPLQNVAQSQRIFNRAFPLTRKSKLIVVYTQDPSAFSTQFHEMPVQDPRMANVVYKQFGVMGYNQSSF